MLDQQRQLLHARPMVKVLYCAVDGRRGEADDEPSTHFPRQDGGDP